MNGICMIAHRGYSGKYHQNTELAFIRAAEHGSGGAETDIRVTRDGALVCSHDAGITLCDGTALTVAENDLAALISRPLKNMKTDDAVYLCTFERYLEIMKRYGMICFIELKGAFTDAQERRVMETIARTYDMKKCILQSFQFDNLVRVRNAWPDLPLMYTYGASQRGYECCFDYGISIDADYNRLTEEMVRAFHSRGLEVGAWTCNTPESLALCRALGVDYIEADVFGGED